MAGNRFPIFAITEGEAEEREIGRFYEKTSKATLMEVLEDFCIEYLGESEATTEGVIEEIKRRITITANVRR